MNAKLIIGLILVGATSIIILQNIAVMDLDILFWSVPASSAVVMSSILMTGIILGLLLHGIFNRRDNCGNNRK